MCAEVRKLVRKFQPAEVSNPLENVRRSGRIAELHDRSNSSASSQNSTNNHSTSSTDHRIKRVDNTTDSSIDYLGRPPTPWSSETSFCSFSSKKSSQKSLKLSTHKLNIAREPWLKQQNPKKRINPTKEFDRLLNKTKLIMPKLPFQRCDIFSYFFSIYDANTIFRISAWYGEFFIRKKPIFACSRILWNVFRKQLKNI